jgi:hypothetical protein
MSNIAYDNLDYNIFQINATTPSTLYFLILSLIFIILYLIFFSRQTVVKTTSRKNEKTIVHTNT